MKFRNLIFALLAACFTTAVASAQTARLQVIHNAADPAATTVDVYVNGGLFIDDFDFREATEFKTVPAGVELNIGIAGGGSSSADDTITNIPVTLAAGKTYVAIANGVLDPSMFAANPNAEPIGFELFARDGVRESSRWGGWFVDLMAFHGATDAPAVDVRLRKLKWGPLFSDLQYGDFSHYRTVFPLEYTLDVTLAGQRDAVVVSYKADLRGLKGGAAVVFASGFLDPAANQGGEAFGLFAALPNGAVAPLPVIEPPAATARLQVIHNAADPAAATVDIYVNGGLYEDDFDFREATEFRTVPAGVELNIGIAGGSSSGADDTIANIPVTLEAGKTYVAIASGVLDPTQFAENPSGKPIGFALIARDGIREKSRWSFATKIMAFHGATDAPAVDIYAQRSGRWWKRRLIKNLSYGEYQGYAALRPRNYTLSVTPAGQPNTVVASFEANLNGLGGGTAVVFASGFLSPADNQGGEAFGLFAALANGTVVALPAVSPVAQRQTVDADAAKAELPRTYELAQNFPNPFNPATTISFALPEASDVTLQVFNILGQEVRTLVQGRMEAGEHQVDFDARNLASGLYFYRLQTGDEVLTRKMTLMK